MNNLSFVNSKLAGSKQLMISYHVTKRSLKLILSRRSPLEVLRKKMEIASFAGVKLSILMIAVAVVCMTASGCGGTGTTLGTPVITGISPSSVARGSSITITGSNLNGTYTTATFVLSTTGATYSATASSGTTSSVSVVVPTTIPTGTFNVDVATTDSSGDQSSASNTVSIVVS